MRRKAARRDPNRYEAILEKVFLDRYRRGAREVAFERRDFEEAARELGIALPKNLGDIIYSFRYRRPMPQRIVETARKGHAWIIRPAGRGEYRFVQVVPLEIEPNPALTQTKVPDATPGVIEMYALGDEQALLARLRYNRLLDVFTGVACHSLQSHLRTTVPGLGQVETDEIYIGIDRRGAHYILTVQAKGARDALGAIQIEQDIALCQAKFPGLIPRPIGAQFMADGVIALFEFEETDQGIRIAQERHYRLVSPEELTAEELATYQKRTE
jgi:hypothetical protein